MTTGSVTEFAVGAVPPDVEPLTVIEHRSLGRSHRLVFAEGSAAALLTQFQRDRFVPQAAVRDSIEVIARAATREVVRFRHEGKRFVLKQETYKVPRVRYGGPFSGANSEREFHNLRKLRAFGVPAVEPLGCGSSRVGPFIDRAFLLTRNFDGAVDLRDWSRAGDAAVSAAQLRDALLVFGVDLARLHRSRHYVWTMYAKNFLVRPGPTAGSAELALCDVPRLVHWPRRNVSMAFAVRDLAALEKWGATSFPLAARIEFLKAYLDALGEAPDLLDWCRRIERRVDRLSHRTSFSSAKKQLQRGVRGLMRRRKRPS